MESSILGIKSPIFLRKPIKNGEPTVRPPTEREKRETDPERRRKIDKEMERIGQKQPKKARPGNGGYGRKKS